MQPDPITYLDHIAEVKLRSLGLTSEILKHAILIGEFYRDTCTDNDANCAPGMFAYSRTSRTLREQLRPAGWQKNDDQNRATVISPNGKIAVAVESGDEGTGIPELFPNVKYQKGDATKKAVALNQPSLFPTLRLATTDVYGPSDVQTWLLLRRRTDDGVFAELSLPAKMLDGRVEFWLERIILGYTPIEPVIELGDDSESQQIEIPIRRRQ